MGINFIFKPMLLIGVFAVFFAPISAIGDIYKYVDSDGVIRFTNTPTDSQFNFYMKEKGPVDKIGVLIERYASMFSLEPALVRAVIQVESNYNPKARSSKGALGLMQLIPETAKDMQVADPLSPEDNIRGGTRYLRLMLDRFDNNMDLALAAYNAGPDTVRRYGGVPPYEETVNYISKVKNYLRRFRLKEK